MNPTTPPLDVLVIGAGQAGLALGYHLKQAGLRFLLVDRHARIGDSWRERFDSLVLFTPRAYSALPGMPLPGDPDSYPTKDELADYLESYAAHVDLPVALGEGVGRLEKRGGLFHATTSAGRTIASRAIVVATGAFQQPVIPPVSRLFAPDVLQLAAVEYRNPAQVPAGTVLVVGDGATGRQIASELSATHKVLLATGRKRRVSRDRILGKSVFWWMDRLGVMRMSPQSRIGRKLKQADPFPGKHLELDRLRERGITVVGRLSKAAGHHVTFASGETDGIDTVIWATGYRDRTDWVHVPDALDEKSAFVQERGVSPVPGLFFIGRNWQTSRGSALVTGVGTDAASLVPHITRSLAGPTITAMPSETQAA